MPITNGPDEDFHLLIVDVPGVLSGVHRPDTVSWRKCQQMVGGLEAFYWKTDRNISRRGRGVGEIKIMDRIMFLLK